MEKEIVKSENNNKLSYENDTAKSSNKSIQSSKIGTILLVEDDLINQKILKTHLEYNGHSVYLAENGKKAVEIFNSNINFDLIFMDIQMPVMTGLEAVDIIRKTQKGKAVPIIALTALALKEDKENILKHDFDLYITKPIELYKLTKIVNEVLNGEKLIFENTIFGQVISFEEPKTEDEKEIILKEHIVSMRKLLLEKRFKELEEKAQVLVDYFNTIKDEEKKLISFKLIMNIRKENWKKCFELIQNLKKELEYKEGDYNENLNS